MADCYSTRICVICGNPFQVKLKSDGTPRANEIKVCSRVCRYDYEQKLNNPDYQKKQKTSFPPIESIDGICGVDGCNGKAASKGYCHKHYQRLKFNGSLEISKPKKIRKDCEWCGSHFTVTESQSKDRYCCSLTCASKLRARKRGLRVVSANTFTCAHCSKEFTRETRSLYNGDAKYCSKECYFLAWRERIRIEKLNAPVVDLVDRRQLRKEITAIKRIKRNIENHFATIECAHCGTVVSKKERIAYKYCSTDCHKESIKLSQIASKSKPLSEKARAGKRAAKSRRRARIRNCENLESFDPFEIFERDGWRCKCCGIKTPKKLRGTIKDNAPELDHIIPLSMGGDHNRQNTQLLCRKCNGEKSNGAAQDQMLLFG